MAKSQSEEEFELRTVKMWFSENDPSIVSSNTTSSLVLS